MEEKCPKCGSPLSPITETSTGKKIQRCSTGSWNKDTKQNEGCDYVKWIVEEPKVLDEKCPKCGSPVLLVTTRFGKKMKKCSTNVWNPEKKIAEGCDYVEWINGTSEPLNKPSFNPPNFVFAPVWTILYILMGISLYLVLTSKKKNDFAVKIFFVQLFLNLSWSLVFFGLHNLPLSLLNIVILWLAILWTIKEFLKISKNAAYLLTPYILWVSFASLLNLSIFLLNR